jgi:hypothetical protein
VGDSSKTAGIPEPEKNTPTAPEAPILESEDPDQHSRPVQTGENPSEAAEMDIEPATEHESPRPSRVQTSQDVQTEKDDDITITGTGYTMPGASTVLTRHKEESPSLERNKAKLNLQDYATFSANELHAGYLSRLHTSRDMEAGLVNLMKKKYEVRLHLFITHIYSHAAPKGRLSMKE